MRIQRKNHILEENYKERDIKIKSQERGKRGKMKGKERKAGHDKKYCHCVREGVIIRMVKGRVGGVEMRGRRGSFQRREEKNERVGILRK